VVVMGPLSPLRRPRDVRDHCLDRVWQDAEVHGALLWIRWATGRQQRRIGDGQILSNGGKSPQARVLAPRQCRPVRARPRATRAPVPLPARTAGAAAASWPSTPAGRGCAISWTASPQPPPDRARRPRGALLSTPPGDRAPALPSGAAPPGPAALPRPLPRPASAPGPRRRPSPTQPCRRDRSPHPQFGPAGRLRGPMGPLPSRLWRRGRGERGEGWPQARAWCP